MAFLAPFYNTKYPAVYHVCSHCQEGNKIKLEDKKQGQVGRLCDYCAKLQKIGRC